MIGRAGRAGMIFSVGESILIFSKNDKSNVCKLIQTPAKICVSSLEKNDFRAIRFLILSLVALKLTNSCEENLNFFKQTLFYFQNTNNSNETNIEQIIFNAIVFLYNKKLISYEFSTSVDINGNYLEFAPCSFSQKILITKLGEAAIKGV